VEESETSGTANQGFDGGTSANQVLMEVVLVVEVLVLSE
jgi:hypothetical protein